MSYDIDHAGHSTFYHYCYTCQLWLHATDPCYDHDHDHHEAEADYRPWVAS